MLKDRIQSDLKTAMLNKDSEMVSILRGLKSAILYVEVAEGRRETGLSDDEVSKVLLSEAKKRKDAADLFKKGGNMEKHDKELAEREIIFRYLPKQLTKEEIEAIIEDTIKELGVDNPSMKDMGKIISKIKSSFGPELDGSTLATLLKKRLS